MEADGFDAVHPHLQGVIAGPLDTKMGPAGCFVKSIEYVVS
jgi:hypothetical protein